MIPLTRRFRIPQYWHSMGKMRIDCSGRGAVLDFSHKAQRGMLTSTGKGRRQMTVPVLGPQLPGAEVRTAPRHQA